jgi:nicotinate phosphoribosyltransferase
MSQSAPSDVSLLTALLKREQRDPQVTLEYSPRSEGIFCGVRRVSTVLHSVPVRPLQIWALEEGASFAKEEIVLRLRGHFLQLAPRLPDITRAVSVASGWATAARALVNAAGSLPVMVTTAVTLPPDDFALFESAAVVGGCVPFDSPLQQGLVPRNLILLMRDTLRAARAFDQVLANDLPRVVPVDTFHDEADEAVRVALALGDKLAAVVVEAEEERNKITPDLLKRVRGQLDLAGFPRVKIFVAGAVSPSDPVWWQQERAPLDGLFAGENLASSLPVPFAVELKESDGKPIARRGLTPGTTPNLRLKKLDGL